MFFKKIRPHISYIFLSAFGLFLGLYLYALEAHSQKRVEADIKNDLATRQYMLDISKQIGVTCNYCHNVKNYKDDSMRTHQISKQHMNVVHMLNTEGFVGQNALKVDCFVCHQGKAKFKYKMDKQDLRR